MGENLKAEHVEVFLFCKHGRIPCGIEYLQGRVFTKLQLKDGALLFEIYKMYSYWNTYISMVTFYASVGKIQHYFFSHSLIFGDSEVP